MSRAQRVRIVGAGLLGASIGLALRSAGVEVTLVDPSPVSVALAADLGAGRVACADDEAPDVVVVAAPPDVVAQVVADELARWPDACITDVASVKARVLDEVRKLAPRDVERYVPGHPMAGRERSGAVAARSDLFAGRTWVLAPDGAAPERVEQARSVAQACGARVVTMTVGEHDAAVAAVSHVPQLAASLVAAQLLVVPEEAVALSGQGVRDVTRIAASDPLLWTQILAGNAGAIAPVVSRMIEQLEHVRDALEAIDDASSQLGHGEQARNSSSCESRPGAESSARNAGHQDENERGVVPSAPALGPRAVLARTIAVGQDGRARIPGKHGTPATAYTTVVVLIPDAPGALGRVFTLVGEAGVSVEDMRLEHEDGIAIGRLELDVLPVRAGALRDALTAAGWSAHVLETH